MGRKKRLTNEKNQSKTQKKVEKEDPRENSFELFFVFTSRF